ncbi:MAG: hypothetical protein JWO92_1174 [Chitinophagaceae bacterium]|nr:hypothetical protein [Chitinophagaceae bacterium]
MAERSDINNTEEEKFKLLFNTYKVPLYDYVQTITGDDYVAEEITQEIFIKLWKRRNDMHHIENIDQYIFRMARNACFTYFKKVALDVKMADRLKTKMSVPADVITDQLDVKEMQRLINEAVDGLSPQRRKVYQLSRVHGLKLDEIANDLDLSVSTVKNHLVAALKHIREYLISHSTDPLMLLFILSFFASIPMG